MYTLRIIEEKRTSDTVPFNQVISNFELGKSYSILEKDKTPEFYSEIEHHFPEANTEGIRALLCGENGYKFFILKDSVLERNDYFIMTEGGKTFERL